MVIEDIISRACTKEQEDVTSLRRTMGSLWTWVHCPMNGNRCLRTQTIRQTKELCTKIVRILGKVGKNWKRASFSVFFDRKLNFYDRFSVQFHPEHAAGPADLEILFDIYVEILNRWKTEKEKFVKISERFLKSIGFLLMFQGLTWKK